MSSFIGHSLAALGTGKAFESAAPFNSKWLWQILLVTAAIAPDLDYLFFGLNSVNNGGLRITHSIGFCLISPVFVTFLLFFFDRQSLWRGGFQIGLAGISHLVLDTLVGGSQGDPLLYPFFNTVFVLPFGILPSSAKISLTNYYFYRNLLIECGILIPVFCLILSFTGKLKLNKYAIAGLCAVMTIFLIWSLSLSR